MRLPNRTDGGSTTKIDNLYGGLHVQTFAAGHDNSASWEPLLPYSYYLSGEWITNIPGNMATFKDYGYNILHIVPAGGLGYNFTQLDEWLDEAQRLGLWIMYDMRWTYQDMALVEWQVSRLKARPNMLLWYTADEPDGRVDPLDATQKAYDMIKSLVPYHPVSLCLNCQNYHFEEYSAGADVILSDTYPIGTNTSWSTKYNTVCNTTYGDCGCDNCVGFNNVSNVPARLDIFRNYEIQLGIPQKPLWGTPQAFEKQDFWQQTPTAAEEVAMTMLSINHGAKGIVMWLFPTTQELTAETSKLAKVLIGTSAQFMLGAELMRGFGLDKAFAIDVSAWKLGNRLLVSVVNAARDPVTGTIELTLPSGIKASSVAASLWGGRGWNTAHGKLQGSGLPPLGTAIFILGLETSPATGGVATS